LQTEDEGGGRDRVQPIPENAFVMREQDVLDVLRLLANAGLTDAWVDGGWGVDALLGVTTREHEDLDLVVRLDEIDAVRDALTQAGFMIILRDWLPTALALADDDGRSVDLHPVTRRPMAAATRHNSMAAASTTRGQSRASSATNRYPASTRRPSCGVTRAMYSLTRTARTSHTFGIASARDSTPACSREGLAVSGAVRTQWGGVRSSSSQ
jgi:Aminoglycoside-2''-adenylyltransferase